MNEIFILLILFQVKHFLCDYPLQNAYMLGKFKKSGWELPLLSHSAVHGLYTFAITAGFTSNLLLSTVLALLDTLIHFIVDRLKAHPDIGGRYTQDNPKFWWCLGADQMTHHLTHYLLIYLIII